MNITTFIGIILAFGSIILGFLLDGGTVSKLVGVSAALIVFGGTFGAVFVSFSLSDLAKVPKSLKAVFQNQKVDFEGNIKTIVMLAQKARQEGILSLEEEINRTEMNETLKKGIRLVVDGIDVNLIKNIMELDIYIYNKYEKKAADIFESAGGYAPTMGIIGTVMGLIQVLGNMSNPTALAESIASAFIATLYGISSANLLWLPMANKIKGSIEMVNLEKELIMEGVLSIQQGENPRIIEEKLKSFIANKTKATQDTNSVSQEANLNA